MIDNLMGGFIEGAIAGYGIAIPVGAISILILEISLTRGMIVGLAAGAGAASADFIFATLAVITGDFLIELLLPIHLPIRILSGVFLIILGLSGVLRLQARPRKSSTDTRNQLNPLRSYFKFLVLTTMNPFTLAYFSALILGRETPSDPPTRIAFALGAGIASLSWQSTLAIFGSKAMGNFSDRFQQITIIIGNLIVLGFGLKNIWDVIA